MIYFCDIVGDKLMEIVRKVIKYEAGRDPPSSPKRHLVRCYPVSSYNLSDDATAETHKRV